MADAADLKSASRKGVWVRVPPSAVASPRELRRSKSPVIESLIGDRFKRETMDCLTTGEEKEQPDNDMPAVIARSTNELGRPGNLGRVRLDCHAPRRGGSQ